MVRCVPAAQDGRHAFLVERESRPRRAAEVPAQAATLGKPGSSVRLIQYDAIPKLWLQRDFLEVAAFHSTGTRRVFRGRRTVMKWPLVDEFLRQLERASHCEGTAVLSRRPPIAAGCTIFGPHR